MWRRTDGRDCWCWCFAGSYWPPALPFPDDGEGVEEEGEGRGIVRCRILQDAGARHLNAFLPHLACVEHRSFLTCGVEEPRATAETAAAAEVGVRGGGTERPSQSSSRRDMELTARVVSASALLSSTTASAALAMASTLECCKAATLALGGKASRSAIS